MLQSVEDIMPPVRQEISWAREGNTALLCFYMQLDRGERLLYIRGDGLGFDLETFFFFFLS